MERDWWKSAVVYQIYPRSFADSDGDGVGDLGGIIAHLDHLVRLGVDVVWLSPVYRSPMDDNGYDISDYEDVDPLFGTLEQLDELIAKAHEAGLKVVMDLVVNHTSDEHPWFVESRSSTDNPKRDWYWWRPPREGYDARRARAPSRPTGARPSAGRPGHSTPTTGDYYLHLFSPKQPDLNWENPEVRAEVHRMMNWWLDRGVDGFRMDVINLISKSRLTACRAARQPDRWRDARSRVIDASECGDSRRTWSTARASTSSCRRCTGRSSRDRPAGLLTVGETPAASVEDGRLYTDAARAELDMVFQFEHVDLDSGPGGKWDVVPFTLVDLKRTMARWQDGLAEVGWNSLYWGNHDQPRAVSRFGNDSPEHRVASAKALATVLHLHRGTPYVYQGDELGMTNGAFERVEDFRDLESLNQYDAATGRGEDPEAVLAALRHKGRDNARTPDAVGRDASTPASPPATPWLAVNPNHTEINAAAQVDDPDSVFTHHQRLIALRHDDPVVVHGDFTMLLPEHPQLYALPRTLGDVRCWSWPTCPTSPPTRPSCPTPRPGSPPTGCWTAAPATRRHVGPGAVGGAGAAAYRRNRPTPRPGLATGMTTDSSIDNIASASGTFSFGGDLEVVRLGYGAMQLTGPGIWGPPRTTTRRCACCAGPSSSASTSSTPPTPTGPTSPRSCSPRRCTPTPTTS